MLISKGFSANDILCFKVTNGEELVAKLVEENDTSYVINKPLTVVPSNQGLGLMQSMFSSDINTNITLNKSHVMLVANVIKDMEAHYIQTTTGIKTAPSGIIT
jgi:hypothetical protein